MRNITPHIRLDWDDETQSWFATCVKTNISSFGDTHDEAIANLREAIEQYLKD